MTQPVSSACEDVNSDIRMALTERSRLFVKKLSVMEGGELHLRRVGNLLFTRFRADFLFRKMVISQSRVAEVMKRFQ